MSLLPNFKKILPTSRQSHTSRYTDSTRVGSERCPYCGGWHSTTAEINACADRNNPTSGGPYFCPRCHQPHPTMSAANNCCDELKRFERKYDPPTYTGYTSGYPSAEPEDDTDWYKDLVGSSNQSSSNGEGMLSGFFNFGSSHDTKQQDSGGGIFDSFFNAGGGK